MGLKHRKIDREAGGTVTPESPVYFPVCRDPPRSSSPGCQAVQMPGISPAGRPRRDTRHVPAGVDPPTAREPTAPIARRRSHSGVCPPPCDDAHATHRAARSASMVRRLRGRGSSSPLSAACPRAGRHRSGRRGRRFDRLAPCAGAQRDSDRRTRGRRPDTQGHAQRHADRIGHLDRRVALWWVVVELRERACVRGGHGHGLAVHRQRPSGHDDAGPRGHPRRCRPPPAHRRRARLLSPNVRLQARP